MSLPIHATRQRRGDVAPLVALILFAFLCRSVALWWTRPEFMGWFNHAPWYWVQTRGLLLDGALPFADLPLLFHAYAGLAGALTALGMDTDPAIIHAQRFLMCLAPALIAWPCWAVLREIHGDRPLGRAGWALVAMAAFLPLTFVHLPELLQKNMLGMLWLAGLMAASHRALASPRWAWAALGCFVLIALTHLGTLAVALLWLAAVAGAIGVARGAWVHLALLLFVGLAATALAATSLLAFDPAAMARVEALLTDGWRHSLLGSLFGPASMTRKTAILAGIVIPYGVLAWLAAASRATRAALPVADRVFWLANLLFVGLLLFPALEQEVLTRFVLFLPLPGLFLAGLHLAQAQRPRPVRWGVAAAGLGVLVMTAGEVANLLRPIPDKAAVAAELRELSAGESFTGRDLVIAPYAVAPLANWFLRVPATLVTRVQREDFTRYQRVFVLNSGFEPATRPGELKSVDTPAERYRAMRQAVPVSGRISPDPRFDQFRWYRLTRIPPGWRFDETGRWNGVDTNTEGD